MTSSQSHPAIDRLRECPRLGEAGSGIGYLSGCRQAPGQAYQIRKESKERPSDCRQNPSRTQEHAISVRDADVT